MRRDPATSLASSLARRGLGTPARVLADAHRPIAPLLGEAASFLGPLLRALGGPARDSEELLRDPDGIERLIAALDGAERERGRG